MKEEILEKYQAAGKLAATILQESAREIRVGSSYLELVESVEARVKDEGAGLAFPLNVSLNEDAAHDTASTGDDRVFAKGDVVKLDLGVQIDGYIADTATTIDLGHNALLLEASREALEAAIRAVRPGVTTGEIGAVVENEIVRRGYRPIANLTGHGLDQYVAHTDPAIPNIAINGGTVLEEGMGEMEITLEEPKYPIGGTTKLGTKVNPQMEACTGIPMYDGQPVEVGPRARLVTYKNYDEKGTCGQNIARQMEYQDCFYEMIDCIDALDTTGKVVADYIPNGDGTLGWASNEAPRGTDVHLARVKDWKVQYFSMLVPTTWNFATCSAALKGAPWQLAEVIMRGYDPCVSCATHMIVLDEDNKLVAQKLIQQ